MRGVQTMVEGGEEVRYIRARDSGKIKLQRARR